jgi:threonylcarbamoyladenosine tRNA methylthiotransferase MtaB
MTQVPKNIKEERAKRAAAVAEEMRQTYLNECVGQVYPVLFEQLKGAAFFGHAPNYMEVLVEADDLHNQVRPVRITGVSGTALLGVLEE